LWALADLIFYFKDLLFCLFVLPSFLAYLSSIFDTKPKGGGIICDLISGFIMEHLSAISFEVVMTIF